MRIFRNGLLDMVEASIIIIWFTMEGSNVLRQEKGALLGNRGLFSTVGMKKSVVMYEKALILVLF